MGIHAKLNMKYCVLGTVSALEGANRPGGTVGRGYHLQIKQPYGAGPKAGETKVPSEIPQSLDARGTF